MSRREDAINTVNAFMQGFRKKPREQRAVLGDGSGNVLVSGNRPGWVYVRRRDSVGIDQEPTVAVLKDMSIPVIDGFPVTLRETEDKQTPEIVSRDWAMLFDWLEQYVVRSHAEQHQLFSEGGYDVVWVESLQITKGLIRPTSPPSMLISVAECTYTYGDTIYWFPGEEDFSLAPYIPDTGMVHWVLVSINTLVEPHALQVTEGDEFLKAYFPSAVEYINDYGPTPPSGCIPLALVLLADTTSVVQLVGDRRNIYDARILLTGTAGTIAATPHRLLSSSVHSDVQGGMPNAGDMVVAGDTPLWKRFPAGDQGQFVTPNEDGLLEWRNLIADDLPIEANTRDIVYSQVVDVVVTDTLDELSIIGEGRGHRLIVGDTLDVGTQLILKLGGVIDCTGNPTVNFRFYLGGTLICSTGDMVLSPDLSQAEWSINVEISCRNKGSSGTIVSHGVFTHDEGMTFGFAGTPTTVNTVEELPFDVTIEWGATGGANIFTCELATAEVLRTYYLPVATPSQFAVSA